MTISVRVWIVGDVKSRQASHFQANKPAITARVLAARAVYRKVSPREFYAREMIAKAKQRARIDGFPFALVIVTKQGLLDRLNSRPLCACCGTEFSFEFVQGKPHERTPTLDRLVPVRGYVDGNVAVICWLCNVRKRDMTPAELRQLADYAEGFNGPT